MSHFAGHSLEEIAAAALAKAKSAFKNGNTGLSAALTEAGLDAPTPQAISQWLIVPVARVNDIERVCGVSRQLLRPDIFGLPSESDVVALFAADALDASNVA